MNFRFRPSPRRLIFVLTALFLLLPTAASFAQDLMPVGVYIYYGQQMDIDQLNEIVSERFYKTGEYTDCVYTPSDTYSPSRVERYQTFHCFDTAREASAFSTQFKASFDAQSSHDANVSASSSGFWSVFAHSFHTGWIDDIYVGETIWASSGIWSLNDFATNEVRLSDNPSYPGQRWTFGWTQLVLGAGPGGSRHAFHCTTAVCT